MPRLQNFFRPLRRAERPLMAEDLPLAFATWASRSGHLPSFEIGSRSGHSATCPTHRLLSIWSVASTEKRTLISSVGSQCGRATSTTNRGASCLSSTPLPNACKPLTSKTWMLPYCMRTKPAACSSCRARFAI